MANADLNARLDVMLETIKALTLAAPPTLVPVLPPILKRIGSDMPDDLIFTGYINPVLTREGGTYTDHPLDRGGPTRWGITMTRARAAGYEGEMKDLTREQALAIYRLFYWTQPMFDMLVPLVPKLAGYLLDIGINQGTGTAGRYPQRALNVLNNGGTLWPDIAADGVFGAMSRSALNSFIQRRGTEGTSILLDMVQAQAAVRYIEIAEHSPSQEIWEWGWQKRAFQVPA